METQEREGIKGLKHDRHSSFLFSHQYVVWDRQTQGLKVPEEEQLAHSTDRTEQSPPWWPGGLCPLAPVGLRSRGKQTSSLLSQASIMEPTSDHADFWHCSNQPRRALILSQDWHCAKCCAKSDLNDSYSCMELSVRAENNRSIAGGRRREQSSASCHTNIPSKDCVAARQPSVREEMLLEGRGTLLVCSREDAVNLCIRHAIPCWLQSAFFLFTSVHSSPIKLFIFVKIWSLVQIQPKLVKNFFSFSPLVNRERKKKERERNVLDKLFLYLQQ